MRKLNRICSVLLAIAFCCTSASPAASAAGGSAGFTAEALHPENQLNPNASYLDLAVSPGQRQELAVLIQNMEDAPITVLIETVTASTNRNGDIHYTSPGLYDETMAFHFSDLAVPKDTELEIPAKATVTATICISIPEEPFPGILLGSIRVVRAPEMEEEEGEGTGIINQYGYTIGVRLTEEPEKNDGMDPLFHLGNVYPGLVNHKAAIVAELRNASPVIARDMAVSARIYPAKGGEPFIEKQQEDISMAPNSVFPLSLVDQAGYGFPKGDYVAAISLKYAGETQEFRREFTIREEEALAINETAVNQLQRQLNPVREDFPKWPYLIGAAFLLLLSMYIISRHQKRPE